LQTLKISAPLKPGVNIAILLATYDELEIYEDN
jgi:hypothetical protein